MSSRLSRFVAALAVCCCFAAGPARATNVQGFVKDDAGAGLAGVSVKFTGDAVGSRPTLMTDAIGFFSTDLPSDTYRVSFVPTAGSRLLADRLFDIVISGDTVLPDTTLFEGVIVSGLVTDDIGAVLPNVDLTFENIATGNKVFTPNDNTNASGQYAVAVPAGTYDVEFTPPEFPPLVPLRLENVEVPGDLTLPTVALQPGVVVNGVVRDSLGVPVESVRLDFYDMASGEKVFTTDDSTNEFGVFRVVIDAGTYEIRFFPPSGGRLLPARLFDRALFADATLPDVILADGFELTGRVVDPDGAPLDAVDLDVFPAGSTERLLTPGDDTGSDGRYRLVVPAGTFDIRHNPPAGSPFLRLTVTDVEVQGDLERPDVIMPSGYVVSGRLVDQDTAPVADVDLDFIDTATGTSLALTQDDSGSDGTFSIAVPPGTYEIRFAPLQSSHLVPFVIENETIDGDRDLGELQLETGFAISGTVVDEGLTGIGGVDIDAMEGDQSVFIEYDLTDEDGTFRFVVREANYRVHFDPGSGSPFFSHVTDEIDVQTDIDLGLVQLTTGVDVDGLVQDSTGLPVVGAIVELTDDDDPDAPVQMTPTDAAGSYALSIRPSNYLLRYLPPSSIFSELDAGSFALFADTTLPLAVLERQPALTGHVVDGAGVGVPDVDVDLLDAVSGASIPLQNDLTDAGGFFAVIVPDGTYQLRLEPPSLSEFFGFTSETFVVSGDTDLGDLVLPQGAFVSGTVVDALGSPLSDVQVGVTEVAGGNPGGTLKSHLATTDRGGQYGFLIAPGDYIIWFDPPPGSQLMPGELGPLTISESVEFAPVPLEQGWLLSGRVLDGGGSGLVGVDVDALVEPGGASIPLQNDTTLADGAFDVLVPEGDYRVRIEPAPLSRLLPTVSGLVTVGPNANVGDLTLSSGFLVEGDVAGDVGQPLEGVDLDLADAATGIDALLVDERTDATGHVLTAAAAGEYFAEFKPPSGSRWVSRRTGPHVIDSDTLLPAVQLAPGWLVSGHVVDPTASPVEAVDTIWLNAGTCDAVFTTRDGTDTAGRFEVALLASTYDVLFDPPVGSGLAPLRLPGVVVLDQDVVVPTQTLSSGASSIEACNGVDDDCDGVVDDGCADGGFDPAFDSDAGTIGWPAQDDTTGYDVVTGDLAALHATGLGASVTGCLADDTTMTSIADPTAPMPGNGVWILVRANPTVGQGSWGSAERDAEIDGAAGACLP